MFKPGSAYVTVHYFGEFEHRNLCFSEKRFQLVVSIDHSTVLFVLKIILLNVFPDLFNDLCSWHGLVTDNCS
jgi:hypothetical protein